MGSCASSVGLFGCGAGVGAAALSVAQKRSLDSSNKDRHVPQAARTGEAAHAHAGSASHSPALYKDSVCAEEQCAWVSTLVEILWPRIDAYLDIMVQDNIIPEIDKALPKMLRGIVKFPKLDLGSATPQFRHIHIREREDKAIVLEVSISMMSDLDVQITALKVPIGIKRLEFSGQLNIVFRPETKKPPFFGGVSVFFIDPPVFDLDFTGAADFADFPVIRDAIRNAILNNIKAAAVLPARIAVDLEEDDEIDEADLTFPDPVGVIRILVRSGKDLRAADWGITGKSSDPYVVIEVGQQRWQSSTVQKTLAPVWEHGNVADLLVYEHRQKATISCYDEDKLTKDDLLGVCEKVNLENYTKGGNPLDTTLDLHYKSRKAGELAISTRWFELTREVPLKGIHPAVARGPSQLLLAVKLAGIVDLPRSWKPPFVLKVSVGDLRTETRPSRAPNSIKPVAQEVEDIALRLKRQGADMGNISSITGLKPEVVALVLTKDASPNTAERAQRRSMDEMLSTHPTFNQILRMLLPWTKEMMNSAVVKLTLIDSKERQVATCIEVPLCELVGKEVHGPFRLQSGGFLNGKLSTKWLTPPR